MSANKTNSDFPRIITLLRKERGSSQKVVASELGISQALLSHYEKGIRECGLDFVVRVSNYYDVSCDFLLGKSPERTGTTLTFEDIPETQTVGKENKMTGAGSVLHVLNKKLIVNSLNILYELLVKANNKELTTQISQFLYLSIYRMFRIVYGINNKNEQSLFTISSDMSTPSTLATMSVIEAQAKVTAKKISSNEAISQKLVINSEVLQTEYSLFSTSLLNVIKKSEDIIVK